jgi:hypothetical protein
VKRHHRRNIRQRTAAVFQNTVNRFDCVRMAAQGCRHGWRLTTYTPSSAEQDCGAASIAYQLRSGGSEAK